MSHKPGVDVSARQFTDLFVYADDTTLFVSSMSDDAEYLLSFSS